MFLKIFISLFWISASLQAVDFHDFDRYQYQFTQEEVTDKIITYLERDPSIRSYYRLIPEALYVGNLKKDEIDYVLYLKECSSKRVDCYPKPSLKGAKIALDPGHFGGIYAHLEERFVSIPGKDIHFDEGTLTYLTALYLKSLLETEGAQVFITRTEIGKGAISQSFFEWLAQHKELWGKNESLSKLFRNYYNKEDLRERASAINRFEPDLTLILHYNAHLAENEYVTTKYNFNLAFIPGAFCKGELDTAEDRYEFMRLIVTKDLEKSQYLSQCIGNQFVKELNVPLITTEKTCYTDHVCLKLCEGVYSRNLTLTRLIHGPLCYGETLIQNHEEECKRLSLSDCEIEGHACPSRVKEVARAYFKGIKAYFGE